MYSIHCIHTTIHLKTLIQSVPPLQHSTHNFNNGTVASPSPSQNTVEKSQEKMQPVHTYNHTNINTISATITAFHSQL